MNTRIIIETVDRDKEDLEIIEDLQERIDENEAEKKEVQTTIEEAEGKKERLLRLLNECLWAGCQIQIIQALQAQLIQEIYTINYLKAIETNLNEEIKEDRASVEGLIESFEHSTL